MRKANLSLMKKKLKKNLDMSKILRTFVKEIKGQSRDTN